jgi:hypothetical protein
MRPVLIGCFDLGQSFGLDDAVFDPPSLAPDLDISLVGWSNPLGRGVLVDLLADRGDLVELWRGAAKAQVKRPEFETGWSEEAGMDRAVYDRMLEDSIARHEIRVCQLWIYSIGTVFTHLELAPRLPDDQVSGVLRCFEFAAYTVPVSTPLYTLSRQRAAQAAGKGGVGLARLSQRKPPATMRDSRGYEESRLFSSFTNVLRCVDEGDAENLPRLAEAWHLQAGDVVEFEYHGRLHYSWSTCLLEPRYALPTSATAGQHRDTPEEQLLRMFACIQLAHVFLGACEAMTQLFIGEMHDQAGGYAAGTAPGRSASDLNRLRTLALAVNTLTTFSLVTPTSEDQSYFAKFEADAQIARHHQLVADACDILYNVQVAEQQAVDARRQFVLNTVVLLLTALTLISVLISGYDFVRAGEQLLSPKLERIELFLLSVILLSVLVVLIAWRYQPGHRSR